MVLNVDVSQVPPLLQNLECLQDILMFASTNRYLMTLHQITFHVLTN